jgi:hypothetical protein
METKTEAKPAGLAKKMAAAMGEIGRVQKRGKNQAQGYSYARADDVAEEAREVLAKHGIAVYPDVLEYGQREVETKSGKMRITWAKVAWTFVDGETGESRTINVPGEGQDSGDKGIYKAMTGSMKYLLMTSFLIPTGEGDPEHDGDERKPNGRASDDAAARVRQAAQRQTKPAPDSPEKRKADIKSRLNAMGIPGANHAELVSEWIGRPVDGQTVFSADDWSKADAGIEQAKQAGAAIARAHDNAQAH